MFRALVLTAAKWGWIEKSIRNSKLLRPLVDRFIAGDTLDDAMRVAEGLAAEGYYVSLDLLGENVATLEEAVKGRDAYIEVVQRIAASPHRDLINISIKLTALGLDQGDDVAERHYRELLEAARPHNIFIRADMEGSPYTERTVAMLERVHPDFDGLTGTVLQSYLYRTHDDIARLTAINCRLRWVKGAYLEPETVAFQDKAKVDEEYREGGKRLLVHARYPALATHDEGMIADFKAFAKERNLDKGMFEWQMLYGIRRDLQRSLHEEGYNVRVYLPYGDAWYPYFSRRLAERPANMLFILRSLFKK